MSSGRMHERGAIHLVTNRCEEGRFFMRPDKEVVEILKYWFARALAKHGAGLEIYAFIFLSNHFHILLRDTNGQLAEFMGYFLTNAAKEINELRGRTGAHFWQGHYDDQIVEGPRTLWNKFLYVLANAVKSGLVMKAAQWKGWSSLEMTLGSGELSISRLDKTRYHNASRGKQKPEKSKFVDTYTFALTPLPMLAGLPPGERRKEVERQLGQAETHYRARWESKQPVGMKAVMAQRWTGRPPKPEQRPKRRFACDDPARERELLEIFKRFIGAYKAAFAAFRRSSVCRRPFHGEWPYAGYPPACCNPVFEL